MPALEVEMFRPDGQEPAAIVKNLSDVVVTAFAISMGGQALYVDWFGEEPEGLAPGATYPIPIPAKPGSGARDNIIEVSVAIFKDGVSQGNEPQLNFITYKRLGRTFETERIRLLLHRFPMTPRDTRGVEVFLSSLGELPRSPEEVVRTLDHEVRVSLPAIRIPDATLRPLRPEDSLALAGLLEGVRNAREMAIFEADQIRQFASSNQDQSAATRQFEAMRIRYASLGQKYRRGIEGLKGGQR